MTPEQIEQFNSLIDEVAKLTKELNELKTEQAKIMPELNRFNDAIKTKINEIVQVING